MKKLALLGLALAVSLGLAVASFAATATVNIQVTITTGDVTIQYDTGTDVVFAGLFGYNIVASSQVSFSNQGDTLADWSMSASNFTDGGANTWPLVGGVPGAAPGGNQARLAAMWTPWSHVLTTPNFLANDVVTTAVQPCTADAYATTFTADGNNVKGFDVPITNVRDVWFHLDTPDAGSAPVGIQMTSVVTVTAAVGL